jgi:hypothetical protein
MQDQDTYTRTRAPAGTTAGGGAHDAGSKAAVAVDTAKETAKDEARAVAATAKQEAGAVMDEARSQVRRLASQARDQATERVRGSHHQLVDRLRGLADEFQEMGGEGDTPGKALVSDLGQRGRRVADYLADRGPEGLLSEVTHFARRRPLAFLAGAVATGFLVGRLGKGVWKAKSEDAVPAQVGSTRAGASMSPAPPPPVPPLTAPAPPPNGPVAEPFAPGRYTSETYDDPAQPWQGEPR